MLGNRGMFGRAPRPVRTASRRRVAAVLALAALGSVAVACDSGKVDVIVEADGSGVVVFEMFLDQALLAELDLADLDAVFEEAQGAGGDMELAEIRRGDQRGHRLEISFQDHRALGDLLVDGVEVMGQRIRPFRSFDLAERGGTWELDAVINPVSEMVGSATRGSELAAALRDVSSARTRQDFELKLSITLPGHVAAANARNIEGSTASWRVEQPQRPTHLTMRSEPAILPTTTQFLAGGAVVSILLLAGWGIVTGVRRRRRRRRAAAAVPVVPGGAGAAGRSAPIPRPTWGPAIPPMAAPSSRPRPSFAPPRVSDRVNPLPPLREGPLGPLAGPPAGRVVDAERGPEVDLRAVVDLRRSEPARATTPDTVLPERPAPWGTPLPFDDFDDGRSSSEETDQQHEHEQTDDGAVTEPLPPPDPVNEAEQLTVLPGMGGEPVVAEPLGPVDPPEGWYPDPAGTGRVRWWDGRDWTDELE